ncbi:MAG: tRNA preQ1(34) S-adenosylmethionine ribosyltransferase-isomerase QueA [Syntrophorhabdaceae bacterium]|nr:tRNA preQ1(34) S-adenosylmethionine ribosyltransferase-isomerase QueA [Syntrophorhabdaceae bacterium]MDD5245494.1 tRNA preQ1(34) S-adenosylmethionine ribosyltransferase-isomerase QueA [Syntrophorhabdaceae bacterium]
MNVREFDYILPKEYIAQSPAGDRVASRLLVFDRQRGTIEHRLFRDIAEYLREGDVLVLNDSKVFPARLKGTKKTGGRIDILLVEMIDGTSWYCLADGIKRGIEELDITVGECPAKLERRENRWLIRFDYDGESYDIVKRCGKMPLPHYIKRNGENGSVDFERYQTVYAEHIGSIAAPTAGFHFSGELLGELKKKGVRIVKVTLHIGTGTFLLIKEPHVESHTMHSEYYQVSEDIRMYIKEAKRSGRRIVACGTSSVRTIETVCPGNGNTPLAGRTELFIYPGYQFRFVDVLITNFHLPRSTPLLLASAFAGREPLMRCYQEAIEKGYRFYSYGDSMMIV